jgi:hypothetical protein
MQLPQEQMVAVFRGQRVHGNLDGPDFGLRERLGLCNYGGLIDPLFTDVEGVA